MTPRKIDLDIQNRIQKIGNHIDRRHIGFNVESAIENDEIVLKGYVHFPQQKTALMKSIGEMSAVKRGKLGLRSSLKILSKKNFHFVQVNVPVANIRLEPLKDGEVGTQAFYGSFMICYFSRGRFYFCADRDGYLGYIHKNDVIMKDREHYLRWMNGKRGRVIKNISRGDVFIPVGAEFISERKNSLTLPDGKTMKAPSGSVLFQDPARNKIAESILKKAKEFTGVPYLWGGKTNRGLDCSGFTQVVYLMRHIPLPRDAAQQINVGRMLGLLGDFSDVLPGDLLFFMGSHGRIIHVGISTGGDHFIHATIREGIQETSIFEPDTTGEPFGNHYIMARRVLL